LGELSGEELSLWYASERLLGELLRAGNRLTESLTPFWLS
jgi:hypothetical protein